MYRNKKILAFIPARGGSKGLPGKNIRMLSGKPLIAWTIAQAKSSKYVDKTIVSTDDKKIADISRAFGAQVPFLRPKALATDNAKVIDALLHTLQWLKDNHEWYDMLVLLQPTSPLRRTEDIDKSIELLFSKNAKAIISVSEVEHHPLWVNSLPENGCMKNFIKKQYTHTNRQDLAVFYKINGAVYAAFSDYLVKQKSFFGSKSFAYVMPKENSIDIDTNIDFKFAAFLKGNIQ